MPIRLKILSIAVALLIVFGIVIGVSAVLQEQVTNEIDGITRYHQPLAAAVADFDVITDEYELLALRLLRLTAPSQSDIDAAVQREQVIVREMQGDLDTADGIIAKAIDDPNISVKSRLVFARLQGIIVPLREKLKPFIATGGQVMQAIVDGRHDDAQRLSLAFQAYEQTFGPDTAEVRRAAAELSETATQVVRSKQAAIRNLSFALFAVAAALGLGIGVFIAGGVIRALRRLIDAAKAVGTGELSVAVPVRTQDEIGQLATAFNSMVEELRSKERIKDTFGKFVDPRIVSGLLSDDPDVIDHAERHAVTVFFSDIEGFTAISEQLTAASMVNLLNHYFDAVTRCVRDSNGIVDKYMGDGVMAFWSPPFSPGDSHAAAACLAALAQQRAIVTVQADLPRITGLRRNTPELLVRMGIATGEAVVGTIGSPISKSFTVMGDTVNLAARLEGINKVYGTRAIIAESTLRLAQHAIEARELDLVAVAGKTEPVRIYELLSPSGELPTADADLRDAFAAGLEAYRARDWDRAERHFGEALKIRADDGPAAVFIERVRSLRDELPSDWDGVWRFTQK